MTIYIAQHTPNGRLLLWAAEDAAQAIAACETDTTTHDTIDDALGYDMRFYAYANSPADLVDITRRFDTLTLDAICKKWGYEHDEEVDLSDTDEWGPDTDGYARLKRFQADYQPDLDGALIGKVGDYDVIHLPKGMSARVSNGDATWFEARSFIHASLFAIGDLSE